jgi:hypothetical protein
MPNRRFPIEPHRAVGPIRFGMSRAEVEAAMGTTPRRGKRKLAISQYDNFQDDGLYVYYDPDDKAIAAEFFDFAELSYPPDVSLDLSYGDLVGWMRSRDPGLAMEAGLPCRSDSLGMAAGAGNEGKTESIILYRPNYYEDSARWRAERGKV